MLLNIGIAILIDIFLLNQIFHVSAGFVIWVSTVIINRFFIIDTGFVLWFSLLIITSQFFSICAFLSSDLPPLLLPADFLLLALGLSPLVALKGKERGIKGGPE